MKRAQASLCGDTDVVLAGSKGNGFDACTRPRRLLVAEAGSPCHPEPSGVVQEGTTRRPAVAGLRASPAELRRYLPGLILS